MTDEIMREFMLWWSEHGLEGFSETEAAHLFAAGWWAATRKAIEAGRSV